MSTEKLQIEVSYIPNWECEYFEFVDCLLTGEGVAKVKLDSDKKFSVNLPDFGRDPVVAAFHDQGKFSFLISDRETGKLLYRLKPSDVSKGFGEIPAALNYPVEQGFVIDLEN
jgi:hypothetical protein